MPPLIVQERQVPPKLSVEEAVRINLPRAVELGFPQDQARYALEACAGNLDLAISMLLQIND
jgi:hypothetical protein